MGQIVDNLKNDAGEIAGNLKHDAQDIKDHLKRDANELKLDVKQEVQGTIAPLVAGIVDDLTTLVKQELKLAKTEVKQELAVAKVAAIDFAIAGALGSLAVLMLSFTLVYFLAWAVPTIPLWGSFGIVTLVFGVAAAFAGSKGAAVIDKAEFTPKETIRSMKENAQWVKGQI